MKRRARKTDGANTFGRSRYNEHRLGGDTYEAGQHWVECMRCGFDIRQKNSVQQWDGLIVCHGCLDKRQPQDFVRGRRDDTAAKGITNSDSDYNRTEIAGSTGNPDGTFNDYLGEEDNSLPFLAPDEIAGLDLWWDFSDADAVWADESRTVPITDGTVIRGMTDKSGNSHHGHSEFATLAGKWETNYRNGLPAGDYANVGINPAQVNTSVGDNVDWAQPFTAFGVGQVPIGDVTDSNALMSHKGINGTQFELIKTTNQARMYTIKAGSNYDISDGITIHVAGEWFMWEMYVDGATSGMRYSNEESDPPFDFHDASTTNQSSYRFAAGTDTSSNLRTGWNTYVGETCVYTRLLTPEERALLFTYFQVKWALTDTI